MVEANQFIEACRGRLAIQRGPTRLLRRGIDSESPAADPAPSCSNRIRPLTGSCPMSRRSRRNHRCSRPSPAHRTPRHPTDPASPGRTLGEPVTVTAIPYFAWASRGPSPMTVWIAADLAAATPAPVPPSPGEPSPPRPSRPTRPCSPTSSTRRSSASHEGGHCHWWPGRGPWSGSSTSSLEPTTGARRSRSSTPSMTRGGASAACRRRGGSWRGRRSVAAVSTAQPPPPPLDRFNTVTFDAD